MHSSPEPGGSARHRWDKNRKYAEHEQNYDQANADDDEGRSSLRQDPVGVLVAEGVSEQGDQVSAARETKAIATIPPGQGRMLCQRVG
jgi:hypothetical protein